MMMTLTLAQQDVRCHRCRERLVLTAHRGWVHTEGGRYVFSCLQCGRTSARDPLPAVCPHCHQRRTWRLDHPPLPEAC